MHELTGEKEPSLDDILERLAECDIVLVEGYKRESQLKIEARRRGAREHTPLSINDPNIVAIAADHPQPGETLPVFDIDDIPAIASFIEKVTGLNP
jgi:molybdopterin-guanine dinucleotide biosynthesis protein B